MNRMKKGKEPGYNRASEQVTEAPVENVDSADALKTFLASGKHNNDPAKIKEMMSRLNKKDKADNDDQARHF